MPPAYAESRDVTLLPMMRERLRQRRRHDILRNIAAPYAARHAVLLRHSDTL